MERLILIKYGELTTKKGNRRTFIRNMKSRIEKLLKLIGDGLPEGGNGVGTMWVDQKRTLHKFLKLSGFSCLYCEMNSKEPDKC